MLLDDLSCAARPCPKIIELLRRAGAKEIHGESYSRAFYTLANTESIPPRKANLQPTLDLRPSKRTSALIVSPFSPLTACTGPSETTAKGAGVAFAMRA